MTYLDANFQYDVGTVDEIADQDIDGATNPGFSGLEWSVIALAQRDRVAGLREPGRIATALAAMFGSSRPNRLADERLEALRRVAVWAWHHGYALPASELRAFFAVGFSSAQYEMLQASIARGRPSRKQRV